jgi:hypothetical protein
VGLRRRLVAKRSARLRGASQQRRLRPFHRPQAAAAGAGAAAASAASGARAGAEAALWRAPPDLFAPQAPGRQAEGHPPCWPLVHPVCPQAVGGPRASLPPVLRRARRARRPHASVAAFSCHCCSQRASLPSLRSALRWPQCLRPRRLPLLCASATNLTMFFLRPRSPAPGSCLGPCRSAAPTHAGC